MEQIPSFSPERVSASPTKAKAAPAIDSAATKTVDKWGNFVPPKLSIAFKQPTAGKTPTAVNDAVKSQVPVPSPSLVPKAISGSTGFRPGMRDYFGKSRAAFEKERELQ